MMGGRCNATEVRSHFCSVQVDLTFTHHPGGGPRGGRGPRTPLTPVDTCEAMILNRGLFLSDHTATLSDGIRTKPISQAQASAVAGGTLRVGV